MSVTLHTTKGDIKIELHCEQVRQPAANFLALCATGAYDGVIFHRVVPGYIVQSGDPTGKGTVSRACLTSAKRLPDESCDALSFSTQPGVVAYANAGKLSPKGVGSQFFITLDPHSAAHLDGTCTIVGKVIKGLDTTVDHIANTPTDPTTARPLDTSAVRIINTTIHANPFATGDVQLDFDVKPPH